MRTQSNPSAINPQPSTNQGLPNRPEQPPSNQPFSPSHLDTINPNSHDLTELFGQPIYTYTRAQAVADGLQVEVTKTAQEAGIRFPMFITRAVYDTYVTVPPGVTGQDEAGRLWDVVWMTRFAIIRAKPGVDRLPVALYVRNDDVRSRLVKLVAVCGPVDIDDPQPAITLMMPTED